jgi:hypothetical protein
MTGNCQVRFLVRGLAPSNGGWLLGRELDKSAYATKQMTTAKTVGAVSSEAAEWYAIDWQATHQKRAPTPSAYRAGNEGWQMEQGEIPTTPANPLLQQQGSRCSTSDGKYWQENSRCGPGNLENTGR